MGQIFLSRRKGIGFGAGVERFALGTVTVPSLLKREGRVDYMGTADETKENVVGAFGKSLLLLAEYEERSLRGMRQGKKILEG